MSKVKQPTDDSKDVQPYEVLELSDTICYSTDTHRAKKFDGKLNSLSLNYDSDSPCITVFFDTVKIRGVEPDSVQKPHFIFKRNDELTGTLYFDQVGDSLKELLTQVFL